MSLHQPPQDGVVPIHYVADPGVLLSRGRWSLFDIEEVIGVPKHYPTQTVRLYLVAPEMSATDLRLDELERIMGRYAGDHDLSVKLVYYRIDLGTIPMRLNDDPHGMFGRQRISFDILGRGLDSLVP